MDTIDGFMEAFYGALSFAPEDGVSHERLAALVAPGARFFAPSDDSEPGFVSLDFEDFVTLSEPAMTRLSESGRGLVETECARQSRVVANLAQVTSVSESRFTAETQAHGRSVNALQLVRSEGRWWLLSMAWQDDAQTTPVPSAL